MKDQVGDLLSHYTLISLAGKGGMGVVWKARDLRLDRIVALKFLPSELTRDPDARERLIREAKAVSALQHTNICTVHDIDGSEDGRMFMVMDFYEGETLRERIAREPISPDEALRIAVSVAEGLAEAHRSGFIHRDITPANIMLTKRGEVKIVDFGLARLADQITVTREGFTAGTVTYMSPEQLRGDVVDLRTDIWSFGVIVCEMLTRTLPFRGDHTAAIMYSITHEEPLLPAGDQGGIPALLRDVCARCLTKDRSARPQMMAEVLSLLRSAPGGPASTSTIPRKKSRLTRWAAITVVGLAGLGIFLFLSGKEKPDTPPSVPGKVRIGVLAFENRNNDDVNQEWPELAQSLFFDGLAGREDLIVFDPTTLNNIVANSGGGTVPSHGHAMYTALKVTSLKYVIDGTILRSGGSRALQMRIVSPGDDAVVFSSSIVVPATGNLPKAVDTLCQRFTDFLQMDKIPSPEKEDIRQWLPPRLHNFAAIKAFVTATQYNYKGDSAAEKYLQQAIDLDSNFVSPRVWLISKLVEKGSLSLATDHFRHLRKLQVRERPFEQAMIDWAGACIAGDLRRQENSLTVALEYSPGNNILLYILGRVKYILQDYRGCVETLTPALETRWEFSPMYYLLGASYEQLEKYAEARAILEQSLTIDPVFPDVYSLLSTMYLRDVDTLNAWKCESLFLRAATRRGLALDAGYASLARRNLDSDLFTNAAKLYGLAVTYREGNASYHSGLADALLGLKDTTAAKRQYRRALILDPSLADAHFRLGEIFEHDGNTNESLRHMRAYVRLDSAGGHAQEARARLLRAPR